MRVRELMTEQPKSCGLNTNLASAVELMWEGDCGVLPVTEEGKLAGIITDRDICIAVGTRNRPAAEIAVKEVANHHVLTCLAEDDVHTAMSVMRSAKIRRLPVVDAQGKLEGMVSLTDIALAADHKKGGIEDSEVVDLIRAANQRRSQKALALGSKSQALEPVRFQRSPAVLA
ncbi:MAG TPA: CBS domain-containing protein [Bryobacteraceae bacterium]|nr:CBS domain-containing protein [Bryobacteraceae bacterium]